MAALSPGRVALRPSYDYTEVTAMTRESIPLSLTERRERYRAVLSGDRCVHTAEVFDPISARIADNLGFEVGMLGGSTASMALLGAPNLAVLTLTEFADQVRRICRASSISLMVDASHGFGNALNVRRTVEELETAGVAALTIEDTVLPQGFGRARGYELISLEEAVGKMKAALAGRQDLSLVIAARTSAPFTGSVAETVRRAKAYERVGRDALFLAGARTREEVAAVHGAVRIPLVLGTPGELDDRKFLADNAVRVAMPSTLPFRAAVKAVYETMKARRDRVSPKTLESQLASPELLAQVMRQTAYDQWIDEYLN